MKSNSEGTQIPSGDIRKTGADTSGGGWRRLFERLMDGRDDAYILARGDRGLLRKFRRGRLVVFLVLAKDLGRRIGNRRRAMAAAGRTDLAEIARFELTARWYLFQLVLFGGYALAFPPAPVAMPAREQRWLKAGMRLAAALNLDGTMAAAGRAGGRT